MPTLVSGPGTGKSTTQLPTSSNLTGTITNDSGGAPVAGGEVWVYNSSDTVKLYELTVNGSGVYSSVGQGITISAGSYRLRYQAPGAFSLGPSEPLFRDVTVSSGATTTQNFVAQAARAFDNFQSYSSDNQFRRWDTAYASANGLGSPQSGDFNFGTNKGANGSGAANISLDTNVVDISGATSKALRYDWPAQPNQGSNFRMMQPYWTAAWPNQSIYLRVMEKFSTDFNIGATNQGTWEYKYHIFDLTIGGNSPVVGSFYHELDPQQSPPNNPQLVQSRFKITNGGDATDTITDPNGAPGGTNWAGDDTDMSSSFFGNWNVWVWGFTGFNSGPGGTVNWDIWFNETFVRRISGPFKGTTNNLGSMSTFMWELGANMNNGPDNAEQRWIREMGVYYTMPSLKRALIG